MFENRCSKMDVWCWCVGLKTGISFPLPYFLHGALIVWKFDEQPCEIQIVWATTIFQSLDDKGMERDRDSKHGSVAKSSTQRDALFKPRRSNYTSSCHACAQIWDSYLHANLVEHLSSHPFLLHTRAAPETILHSKTKWISFIATGLHGCLVPQVWWGWQNLASLSSRSLLTSVRHTCGDRVE